MPRHLVHLQKHLRTNRMLAVCHHTFRLEPLEAEAPVAAEAAVAAVADLFEFGGIRHGWVEVGSAKRQ